MLWELAILLSIVGLNIVLLLTSKQEEWWKNVNDE